VSEYRIQVSPFRIEGIVLKFDQVDQV